MRYLKKIMITTAFVAFGSFMSAPVFAAGVCGPHEKIVSQLENGFEEARTGFGLAGNGGMVELFVSKAKGTWTFMLTRPDGLTCLMATGGNWEHMTLVEKTAEEMM